MSKSKKPRKAYNTHKLKFPNQHPLHIAVHGSSAITQTERMAITKPFDEAITTLRQGEGTPASIASANTVLRFLKRTEQIGVITGMGQYIADCEEAIEAICERAHDGDIANPWRHPTLRGLELDAIYIIRDLFKHATKTLCVREIDEIARYIRARAKTEGAKIIPYQYEPA